MWFVLANEMHGMVPAVGEHFVARVWLSSSLFSTLVTMEGHVDTDIEAGQHGNLASHAERDAEA